MRNLYLYQQAWRVFKFLYGSHRTYLLIYIKYNDDFYFLNLKKGLFPIILPVNLLGLVEEDLSILKLYFSKVFKFSPVKTHISSDYFSLDPFMDKILYISVCELGRDQIKLIEPLFTLVPKSSIQVKHETNLFFNILNNFGLI